MALDGEWRKSSRSNGASGACVEVRLLGGVQVQDTKHRGPRLTFPTGDWRAFLRDVTR